MVDLDDPEVDLALRYCSPAQAPAGAVHLFDETLTPVVSRALWTRIGAGDAPALATPADLASHTLAEEDVERASSEFLSWRHWLATQGAASLQPRRWLYLTSTYQQVQAALAGQGVALARLALVFEALQRGELVEPFGPARRIASPYSYWLIVAPASRARVEVQRFADWVETEARATRAAVAALGDAGRQDVREPRRSRASVANRRAVKPRRAR